MDNTFKNFCSNLEGLLAAHEASQDPEEELLPRQRKQLRNLINLEAQFRDALIRHRWGLNVYRDFVTYIVETRANILAARPFFRERSKVFTASISPALKERNDKTLYKYRINWSFVEWVVKARKWRPGSPILALANQIRKQRIEIVEQNLPLAISQARQFWNATPPSHLSYMDIVQIQCQGMLLAVDKFVPPNDKRMSEKESLARYRTFRAVAIGIMTRDRVNAYSLDQDVILVTCDNKKKKIKDFRPGDTVLGVDTQGQTIATTVLALHDHGVLDGYEVTFDDGFTVVCSKDHKFLTRLGMVSLKDIGHEEVLCEPAAQDRWLEEAVRSGSSDS